MQIAKTLLVIGMLGSIGCSNQNLQTSSTASISDWDLKLLVQSRIGSDPQLAQVNVSADANQNQVTLSGSVQTESARATAVAAAAATRSNLIVVDKIRVIPDVVARSEYTPAMDRDARQKAKALGDKLSQSIDDTWIHTKIEAKLAGQSAASAVQIRVDVFDHQVTLRGEVDSVGAKGLAERISKETDGVRQVTDLLTVKA